MNNCIIYAAYGTIWDVDLYQSDGVPTEDFGPSEGEGTQVKDI